MAAAVPGADGEGRCASMEGAQRDPSDLGLNGCMGPVSCVRRRGRAWGSRPTRHDEEVRHAELLRHAHGVLHARSVLSPGWRYSVDVVSCAAKHTPR